MNKILVLLITILIAVSVSGQNFEGKITYSNSYKSKLPNLKDEQFTSMMGNKEEFYIKGGNYKSVVNGTFDQWQLYINKENKLYSKLSTSDTIFWNSGTQNDDSIITVR